MLFQTLASFAQVSSANMKWNPGHYILTTLEGPALEQITAEFKDIPSLRGIQRSYYWSLLEPAKGVYDFSLIEKDLALAKKYGKKLSIIIGYKYQISSTQSSLPQYVLNLPNALVDGIYVPSYFVQGKLNDGPYNQGHHANFGHPGTLAAFSNLLKALGSKYDSNLDITHLQFIETSIGADPAPSQVKIFLDGIEKMETVAKAAFPTTPIFQNLNYPRNRLPGFINNLTINKMGFGGPDVFIGAFDEIDNGLTFTGTYKGIYRYNESNFNMTTKNNLLPIAMQVHHENFIYETMNLRLADIKTTKTPDVMVTALFDFAIDRLHSNYIMWQVFNSDPYKTPLKNKLLAEKAMNPLKMGGVLEACPSNFSSCLGASSSSDTTKPTVAITSPASGSLVSGSVNVGVNADDNVGVVKVELYANGALKGTLANSPYNFTYTAPTSVDIEVVLVARAYDANGNYQDSAGIPVLVKNADTTAPTVTISNPTDGAVFSAGRTSIWIVAAAEDLSGIKSMKLYINGELRDSNLGSKNLSFEWRFAKPRVRPGNYEIKVIAVDNNGNPKTKIINIVVR